MKFFYILIEIVSNFLKFLKIFPDFCKFFQNFFVLFFQNLL